MLDRSIIIQPGACPRHHFTTSPSHVVYTAAFVRHMRLHEVYTVWVKKIPPPWNFQTFSPKPLGIFSPNFTCLSTLDYKFLFNYLQLWQSYAILSATTIMCSKCPPSTETHLMWQPHNFVIDGGNQIKIFILACIWTLNRCTKFGWKIPNFFDSLCRLPVIRICSRSK